MLLCNSCGCYWNGILVQVAILICNCLAQKETMWREGDLSCSYLYSERTGETEMSKAIFSNSREQIQVEGRCLFDRWFWNCLELCYKCGNWNSEWCVTCCDFNCFFKILSAVIFCLFPKIITALLFLNLCFCSVCSVISKTDVHRPFSVIQCMSSAAHKVST